MRPFVVGITGPSGSGKSRLASGLAHALGQGQCAVLSLDRYYRGLPDGSAPDEFDFDNPEALDRERFLGDLRVLRSGAATRVPEYDFQTHLRRAGETEIAPAPILVVEGIFVIGLARDTDLLDFEVYLDLSEEECLRRRTGRDAVERAREPDEINERFERFVRPSIARHVAPQKVWADLLLDATLPPAKLLADILAALEARKDSPPPSIPSDLPPVFGRLARRVGAETLSRRLSRQSNHLAGFVHQGEGVFVIERVVPFDSLVDFSLRACGLRKAGLAGARDLRIEQNTVRSPAISPALDGFRILHLSDLHLDLETGVLPQLTEAAAGIPCDLTVITGDFRNSTRSDFARSVKETGRLLSVLRGPVFAILGNHDFIEMAPLLEDFGARVLMNESICVQRGAGWILLAGVDDPHFYKTHDLGRAAGAWIPTGAFRILLSHSPETYRDAEGMFDFQLSGHTHGGQICLPGGFPLIRNGNCPAAMVAGPWRHGRLMGYTSRGTGCCGVPARFFCPPEITVHTLRPDSAMP